MNRNVTIKLYLVLQEKIQEWVNVGYHVNILQAFKVENSNGRIGIFAERVSGKTLRDWINADFFKDKNKIVNSKRILNVLLQVAVGMNYLHRKGFVHQTLTPDNIYVEQDKCLKIGNMYNFNGGVSGIAKSPFVGGSPEYWSH